MTVLRAVQFHGQLGVSAVEIEDVIAHGVLATEFETGKTSSPQRAPERLFVVRLIATQLAGDVFEAHARMMFFATKLSRRSYLLPLLAKLGEGWGVELKT